MHSFLSPDGKSTFRLCYASDDDAEHLETVHVTHGALSSEEPSTRVAVKLSSPCAARDLRLVAAGASMCCLWCVHERFLVLLSFAGRAAEAVDVALPMACDCLSMVKRKEKSGRSAAA